MKYDFLTKNRLTTILFQEIQNIAPNFFFTRKNFDEQRSFENGLNVNELFPMNNVGIVTSKDKILIKDYEYDLVNSIYENYIISIDNSDIKNITYRPFDNKLIYYNPKIIERAREKVMKHFFHDDNLGLVIGRQGHVVGSMPWNLSFITNSITDFNLFYRGGGVLFPLYLYSESSSQQNAFDEPQRVPNLNMDIVNQIAMGLGLTFTNEKEENPTTFAPIDLLDYIYAVLHSHTYREKYKEFLKTDFPRVPAPLDHETFWKLVKLGGELRQIHLLESPIVEKYITGYPEDGDNVVTKPTYKNGHVYINDTQYFSSVPEVAWNFFIGGYQPAQKWLKDRKDRELSYEDILHYQKIILALSETDRLMKEIDLIEIR
jgi:predicted helicase